MFQSCLSVLIISSLLLNVVTDSNMDPCLSMPCGFGQMCLAKSMIEYTCVDETTFVSFPTYNPTMPTIPQAISRMAGAKKTSVPVVRNGLDMGQNVFIQASKPARMDTRASESLLSRIPIQTSRMSTFPKQTGGVSGLRMGLSTMNKMETIEQETPMPTPMPTPMNTLVEPENVMSPVETTRRPMSRVMATKQETIMATTTIIMPINQVDVRPSPKPKPMFPVLGVPNTFRGVGKTPSLQQQQAMPMPVPQQPVMTIETLNTPMPIDSRVLMKTRPIPLELGTTTTTTMPTPTLIQDSRMNNMALGVGLPKSTLKKSLMVPTNTVDQQVAMQQPVISKKIAQDRNEQRLSSFVLNKIRTNEMLREPLTAETADDQLVGPELNTAPSDNFCVGHKFGEVLPHPTIARKFLVCQQNGEYVTMTCPGKLKYNVYKNRCDHSDQEPELACKSSPCKNGGECYDTDNYDFLCECAQGFSGETCEHKVSGCSPNPCGQNGLCHILPPSGNRTLINYCTCNNDQGFGLSCSDTTYKNPCTDEHEMDYFPVPFSRNLFIHCENDLMVIKTCTTPLVWSQEQLTCTKP